MKYRILFGCLIFVLAVAVTPAQAKVTQTATAGKVTLTGTCGKPDIQQSAPAGDQPGHAFTLGQGKCASKGEVGGVSSKEGTFTEHGEVTGDKSKAWGTFVETYATGDKIFYSYETTATMKGPGVIGSGSNKWQMTGGTGKMKRITGSGTCKITGNAVGGLDYNCTGEYMLTAAPAPAKK